MDVILLILVIYWLAIVLGCVFLTWRLLQTRNLELFEGETNEPINDETNEPINDETETVVEGTIRKINSEIKPMIALNDVGVQILLQQYVKDAVINRLNTLQQKNGKHIIDLKQYIDTRVGEMITSIDSFCRK